jgi:hypothetical protein
MVLSKYPQIFKIILVLLRIINANLILRSPKAIGKKDAKEYLTKTESLITWLTQKMKQSP